MNKQPITLLALAFLGVFDSQLSALRAQGTAFTYQGRLNTSGNPAAGNYDFRFRLAADPLGNTYLGGPVLTNGITVNNGLFVATIDFGAGWFNGSNYWMQVDVKTNGAGSYSTLTPLQALAPTPYANFANTASNLSGTLPAAQLSGTISSVSISGTYGNPVTLNNANNAFSGSFSGNGANVTNVNAATFGGLSSSNFWKTGGNAGTTPGPNFVGTTDNQPLELKVNGARALRLEPNTNGAPNVIGGSPNNFAGAGVVGATINGGGAVNYLGFSLTNKVTADFGTVGGGYLNTSSGGSATVGGGVQNTSSAVNTVVSGGGQNTSSGSAATVGGGLQNASSGPYATVPGGAGNTAGGQFSFAAGHDAKALHDGAFVWSDSLGGGFTSTTNDQFLIRASGGVGIGTTAPGQPLQVGDQNLVSGSQGMMRFGSRSATHPYSRYWDIGVPKADEDLTGQNYSFVIDDPQLGAGPEFVIRYDTGNIGIGTTNPASALQIVGTVTATSFSGSGAGLVNLSAASLTGGTVTNAVTFNNAASSFAGNGGGLTNLDATQLAVGSVPSGRLTGVYSNSVSFTNAGNSFAGNGAGLTNLNAANLIGSVPGGALTSVPAANLTGSVPSAALTSVPAGNLTGTVADARLSANVALRSGGNTFSGGQIFTNGTVGIGTTTNGQLLQVGDQTLAAGSQGMMRFGSHSATAGFARYWDIGVPKADADATGRFYSFVIDDPQLNGTVPEFVIRYDSGNVGIGTETPSEKLHVIGNILASGTVTGSSDRNVKEHFSSVNPCNVLAKVSALPITEWNYIADGGTTRHIGPMAQDFYSAFNVGMDDKHISMVDADGVALAAIQGLNQKLEVQSQNLEEKLRQKEWEIAELRTRLDKLEQLLNHDHRSEK